MMKKILMSVYAACALLVIAGSLLWFVFTLHSDSTTGKAEALKSFKLFSRHTGEILSEAAYGGDSARLQPQLEQLCRNYHTYIQSILMKDSDGIVFMWPPNTDFFSYNEQYAVTVKNLPLFFTAAQTHIPINGTDTTITVHAVLQILPIETVFNRGQVVFFLLLLIVLMTVTVLICSYIDLKPAETKSSLKSGGSVDKTAVNGFGSIVSGKDIDAADYDTDKVQPQSVSPTDISAVRQEEQAKIFRTPSAPRQTSVAEEIKVAACQTETSVSLNEQLESLNRLHIYDDEREAEGRREHQDEQEAQREQDGREQQTKCASSDTPDAPSTGNEQGFSAENYGFFENHTQPLKNEINGDEKQASVTTFENTPLSDAARSDNRSLEQATLIEELTTAITETAVAEEDLTLMLIHVTDIPHNQQIIHLLRSSLDRIHKIFIFNKDTLGIIIFYAPLDQAMHIASTLYDEIHRVLEDSAKKSLGIGLTTRAGRLIPAPRMIEEASAAIGKATQEGSDPIVAFRVNPDKYRRCLARLS